MRRRNPVYLLDLVVCLCVIGAFVALGAVLVLGVPWHTTP